VIFRRVSANPATAFVHGVSWRNFNSENPSENKAGVAYSSFLLKDAKIAETVNWRAFHEITAVSSLSCGRRTSR
jgi:hypothetical protein